MLLQIHSAPRRQTILRMGCGYPCAANADVTDLFKALPKDQWLRVSVDLACFVDNGLDVGAVDMPFLLLTRGALDLSLADVRIVPGAAESATVRC